MFRHREPILLLTEVKFQSAEKKIYCRKLVIYHILFYNVYLFYLHEQERLLLNTKTTSP